MTTAEKLAPRLGLSSEIARTSGLDRRWVAKVLKGEGNPTIETIARIAAAVSMNPEDVAGFIQARRARFCAKRSGN